MFKRKRPLFSVIISCYNSGNYLGYLLSTLTAQGIRKDELEVIISDDCSSIKYDEVLDKFRDKLNIKVIVADHNWGYPGHTREQGVSIATGEWITFADHDDGFFDNALKRLKKYIKKEHPEYAMYTEAWLGDSKTKKPARKNTVFGITHGEFFNLDNFWKKYDLHYSEKIKFNEDLYINNKITHIIQRENLKMDKVDIPTYCWMVSNKESLGALARVDSNGKFHIETSFKDYIKTTFELYCDDYIANKDTYNIVEFMDDQIKYIFIVYAYMQSMYCMNREAGIEMDQNNYIYAAKAIKKFKDIAFLTTDQIIDTINKDYFGQTMNFSYQFVGPFYPIEGFPDWMKKLESLEDAELEEEV